MEVKFDTPPLGPPDQCRAFLPHVPRNFKLTDLLRFASTNVFMKGTAIFPDMADQHQIGLIPSMRFCFALHHFKSDHDYVVLIGDPIVAAATFFVLGKAVDKVTLLRYDGQTQSYWPFELHP